RLRIERGDRIVAEADEPRVRRSTLRLRRVNRTTPSLHTAHELIEDTTNQLGLTIQRKRSHARPDQPGGEVPTKRTEPLHQPHRSTTAGSRHSRGKTRRPTAHHQDIRRLSHRNRSCICACVHSHPSLVGYGPVPLY